MSGQGWNASGSTDTITFNEAPPAGTNNVVVKEFASGGVGGTDVWAVGLWSGRYGYPSEVEFFGDRLWFAGSPSAPQRVDASQTGDYTNFGRSSPIIDSDALSFTMNARQVNAIEDLIPLDNLLVLTTGGEWKTTGGQDDVITPSTVGMKPQSYHGTGDVPARVIGESAIFIQKQGSKVRDLGYQFEKDGFRGNEISVWADHLVRGYTLTGIEHMKAPWPLLLFPRNDGVLVACTYMPEQEVIGWHRHDTDGKIVDVCCLPGEEETEVYLLVQRTIDGAPQQYIEQLAPTRYDDPLDWHYVDCGLTYDGRNTTATTVTLTSAGDWDEAADLTLTASAPLFVGASDEGDGFVLERVVPETDPTTGITSDVTHRVRVQIIDYVSATVVTVNAVGTVPVPLRAYAASTWTLLRDTISGLEHLEGKAVAILADGSVQGQRVVTAGAITLDVPSGVVHVGLPYRAQIETLELNNPGGESMRGQKKLLYKATILVRGARGIKAGTRLDLLDEIPQREFESYEDPTAAFEGVVEVNLSAEWGRDSGRLHIVSDDPLPMEVLSITPRAVASD